MNPTEVPSVAVLDVINSGTSVQPRTPSTVGDEAFTLHPPLLSLFEVHTSTTTMGGGQ